MAKNKTNPNGKTYLSINQLRGWQDNPRGIKIEEFERLKRTLSKVAQFKPLLVAKDEDGLYTVLGGNMRLKAYQELDQAELWVEIVDAPTQADRIQIALADNDQYGYYEKAKLEFLLNDIDLDLEDIKVNLGDSISLAELFQDEKEVTEDDYEVDVPKEPKAKVGEIYQLGDHRLMCGDATSKEDVEKLMDGKKADITFTSPPYNVGHNLGYKSKDKYDGSGDNIENYDQFLTDWVLLALENSRYVFNNIQMLANNKHDLIRHLADVNDYICDVAFWKKSQVAPMISKNTLNTQTEFIWIMSKENKSRAIDTAGGWQGQVNNLVETTSAGNDNKNADIHNATMPIALCDWVINNFTQSGMLVVDVFGGTGTTLIACEQTNRKCYMMELDPKYVDVIIDRWEKFTGETAVKL